MPTFTASEIRTRAARVSMYKSASQVLHEHVRQQTTTRTYDIFLSHAFSDAALILGVKASLEDMGYSVYVDWVEDPSLDRSQVSKETAAVLRSRMSCCRCLFYASTEGSSASRWMPWECGFVDGQKGKSAILPITQSPTESFYGQEYLGLYPYVTRAPRNTDNKMCLWIQAAKDDYVAFEDWLKGKEPRRH